MFCNLPRRNFTGSAVAAGLSAVAFAAAAAAQSNAYAADPRSPAAGRCETALEQRIQSEHPHTDRVILVGGSLVEWPAGRDGAGGLAGDGRMLRGDTWDDFEFTCWLDARSGAVNRLEWSGPYHDGKPVRGGHTRPRPDFEPLDSGAATARVCLDALRGEIRRDHPRSGRLELGRGALEQSRRQNTETVVRGQARFEGARGQWHPISFQCGFEAGDRRTSRAWYELD